jgi:hypothetical protein
MRPFGLLLCVVVAAAGIAPAGDPPAAPLPPIQEHLVSYGGEVTAVGAESITVRGYSWDLIESSPEGKHFHTDDWKTWVTDRPHTLGFRTGGVAGRIGARYRVARSEWTQDSITLFPIDGGAPVVLTLATMPEWRFVARGPLARGEYKKSRGARWSYGLGDVRVGDRVEVEGAALPGVEFVESISISRRPGGRVPPAPDDLVDPPDPRHPWFHHMKNAEQDWQDKGIPLPKGFHEFKRWVHDAPPPREAKPKA